MRIGHPSEIALISSTSAAVQNRAADREEIAALTREYEARRGPVKTIPIIQRQPPRERTASPAPHDRELTMQEAADYLGINKSWLKYRAMLGLAPHHIKRSNKIFYTASTLDAWRTSHPDDYAQATARRITRKTLSAA